MYPHRRVFLPYETTMATFLREPSEENGSNVDNYDDCGTQHDD